MRLEENIFNDFINDLNKQQQKWFVMLLIYNK